MIEQKALDKMRAMLKQAEITAESNDSEQAYEVSSLYPYFPDIPEGTRLKEKTKVLHSDGILYEVKEGQTHAKQSNWAPDVSPSLFTPIPRESEAGTKDNPIEWTMGMISEEGKYYTDGGVTYLCIESSGIGLYGSPKDLSRYFSPV